MAGRENKYDAFLGIPVEQELKDALAEIGKEEERTPTVVARLALKEFVTAWRAAKKSKRALATSSK